VSNELTDIDILSFSDCRLESLYKGQKSTVGSLLMKCLKEKLVTNSNS